MLLHWKTGMYPELSNEGGGGSVKTNIMIAEESELGIAV